MTIRHMFLGLALAAMVTAGFAATVTVGPSETYTTVKAGVAAAVQGDTVLIRAGGYVEACPINVTTASLTIMADTDAVVSITQDVATSNTGQVIISSNAAGFKLQGASIAKKLLLVGGSATAAAALTLNGAATIDNIAINGKANGIMPIAATTGDIVVNDSTIDMAGILCYGNGVALPNRVRFNRCTFATSQNGIHSSNGGEVVMTDCVFNSCKPVNTFMSTPWAVPNETITLINPSRTGQSRLIDMGNQCTVNLLGKSAEDKCFMPSLSSSYTEAYRCLTKDDQDTASGVVTLNITDCVLSDTLETGDGELNNDMVVNLNRVRLNGSKSSPGKGWSAYNVSAAGWAGKGSFTINALNCMLVGAGTATKTDSITMHMNKPCLGGNNLNATHCTIWSEGKGNTWWNGCGNAAGNSDTLVLNYCALAQGSGKYAVYNHWMKPTGSYNVYQAALISSWPAGADLLTNSVQGDPGIDAEGRLTLTSDLCDRKAVGSTTAIDFFGKPRPRLGTIRDIGADEGFVVPVELSTFQVE